MKTIQIEAVNGITVIVFVNNINYITSNGEQTGINFGGNSISTYLSLEEVMSLINN